MPSATPLKDSHVVSPKKNIRTVFGLGAISRSGNAASSTTYPAVEPRTTLRKSVDTARSYRQQRKQREDRTSVTEARFYHSQATRQSINIKKDTEQPSPSISNMTNGTQSRRTALRMDAQDGPWSVSVAETPHDARSYSLYIKTPTHNLTLTRTAMEILELHEKLQEFQPGTKLPTLPIDASSLPSPPPKRKSTFLNTLSRLASPTSKSSRNSTSARRTESTSTSASTTPYFLPTPVTTPFSEIGDPFSMGPAAPAPPTSPESMDPVTPLSNGPSGSSTITGLAAYLTTISNTPGLRQARVWKRFVRVRTDDLQSVRVERAIKRVRSDLAAHVSPKTVLEPNGHTGSATGSATHSEVNSVNGDVLENAGHNLEASAGSLRGETIREEELPQQTDNDLTAVDDARPVTPKSPNPAAQHPPTPEQVEDVAASVTVEEQDPQIPATPNTPIASDPPINRIHRSQSADPDKSTRLSRAYTSSASNLTGNSSQAGDSSLTGDESSVSIKDGRRTRKKQTSSVEPKEKKKSMRKVVVDDFEMMRVLGKGCAGKVLLVRHKATSDLYALKAITKRHVLAHQELQHTLTEQAVLKRMSAESKDPFVVKLWWSFHDKENLFLVMDFHPGGDLATQLARWGRLGRDRARFYAAEIVEGVEGLHAAGVIYRDLKPENILIGADGHIVLTDFGLSKEFPLRTSTATPATTPGHKNGGDFYSSVPGTPQPATPPWMKGEKGDLASGWPGQIPGQSDLTSTFCGTAEYLAPEVIQGVPYGYEVDWWSFGTMLYEMLTGITPFWANNHSDMYVRVLQDELIFPDDRAIDQDTKSLIRGLLQRNPALRMCEPRIKRHPYFSMIDWSHVYYKRYIPPYIPPIDPSNASDTQNFDDTFLDMEPVLDDVADNEQTDTDQEREQTDTDRTDGEESNTTPSQSRSSSIHPRASPQPLVPEETSVDLFDGYSFKGRHSILIDDEEEDVSEEEDDEDLSTTNTLAGLESPTTESAHVHTGHQEEIAEPKTPEARPTTLPEPEPIVESPVSPTAEEPLVESPTAEPEPIVTEQEPEPETSPPVAPEHAEREPKTKFVTPKPPPARPGRTARGRREKSGVPALDRYLSDTIDEDGDATERDDEDDDWDFVEAADGEDRNGSKGTSLFARGVVDRYRLAVFRKVSTPSQRSNARSFSGASKASNATISEAADSPSPSEKQRRGRRPGLTFRKHPRQFLRPKTPPSSYSPKSGGTAKSFRRSNSATVSAISTTSSAGGLLTPSTSVGGSLAMSPSLNSGSAVSVGDNSFSSEPEHSGTDARRKDGTEQDTVKGPPVEEPEKHRTKKLRKYKENAEKVFSIFASSPRQP